MKATLAIILSVPLLLGASQLAPAESALPSPYQQVSSGVAPEDVRCREGHVLALRADNRPACLTSELAKRVGWEVVRTEFKHTDKSKYMHKSETRDAIREAIDHYSDVGAERAFEGITYGTPDGERYVFVINATSLVVEAHGANETRVGKVASALSNAKHKTPEQILGELDTKGESWIKYSYPNPVTGTVQDKKSLLILHDGHIFGSGYYIHKYDPERKEAAKTMVDDAIGRYKDSPATALDDITSSAEFRDKELYVFVINNTDGIVVAHGGNASRVGVSNNGTIDVDGNDIGMLFADTVTEDGAWVEYKWYAYQEEGQTKSKLSWIKLHGDLIFGSGVYEKPRHR